MPVTRASGPPYSNPNGWPWPTTVSPNGRYIVDQFGNPWLMLSDQLLPSLSNAAIADYITVMQDRMLRGYNSLWVCLINDAYIGALDTHVDFSGNAPFTGGGLSSPNAAYWTRVDQYVAAAASFGITLILTPIETAGTSMALARTAGTAGCFAFGQFLGNRYKNNPNIIWLHGNDFGVTSSWVNGPPGNTNINGGIYDATPTPSDATLAFNIASGIRSTGAVQLHTAEINYQMSVSTDSSVGDVTSDSTGGGWRGVTDLTQAYTYYKTYDAVLKGYLRVNSNDSTGQSPRFNAKPVFMGEANYEGADNLGGGANPATPYVLRCQNYWTVLAGGLGGQIWGNKALHHMAAGWQNNLNTTGAQDATRWATFFRSNRWWQLAPDFGPRIFLTSGFGTYDGSTTGVTPTPGTYATAAITADGTLGIAFTPVNQTLTISLVAMAGNGTARWFDPTNGAYTTIGSFTNSGSQTYTPSATNSAGATDWVLVLTVP